MSLPPDSFHAPPKGGSIASGEGDVVGEDREWTPGAATALCGIVLHPAGHTRSPAMHNAAFRALDVDAIYLAFDVRPEGLAAALQGVRALAVRQLAVSLPHKVAVMEHLDEVDPTALRIGAVNTSTVGTPSYSAPGAAPAPWCSDCASGARGSRC
jgi:hypothetical protein